MTTRLEDKIKKLDPAHRRRIEARAAQLISKEMTLRDLRKALKLTQARVAKAQNVSQDSISRLEQRSDFLISTLRKTVEAMGGSLALVVQFVGREPVILSGLASGGPRPKISAKR
jgi:transcriptional regulator with XRE-family HTH domain